MMDFRNYLNKITGVLQAKYHISEAVLNKNMEYFFESYINSVPAKVCFQNFLRNTLTESKAVDKLTIYKNNVLNLIEKCGYKNPQKYYRIIKETIEDYYYADTDEYDCSSECINQIKSNKIDIKHSYNPKVFATDIKNKLLYLLHNANIDNFFLIDTKVNPTSVTLICNITMFEGINNIDTSINGYCKTVNKQLQPFIKMYVDAGSKLKIIGYQVDNNTLYCRVAITIDIEKSDGFDDKKLNITELARIIKFYISVFDTFTSQNSQLYNANEKTGY